MGIIKTVQQYSSTAGRSKTAYCILPTANYSRGFTLLIAVIFMSVLLSLGLALASLAYKQEVLAASALESQSAFYAADAGLECALRADQQDDVFDYSKYVANGTVLVTCAGSSYTGTPTCLNGVSLGGSNVTCAANQLAYSVEQPYISLAYTDPLNPDAGTDKSCAIITVYKPTNDSGLTYIFSQGYDTSCESLPSGDGSPATRYVSRGLSATYQD